ncbi:MAG: zf-TFIIB domain-containing protein [Desulfuromonadales bacterium]|nr:zf-TFIIB domain-containing protein [Desulfuromonadales bacterium]
MPDAWEERKKALENQYFYELDKVLIERIQQQTHEKLIRKFCKNRCPKCGDQIEPMEFRGVPLDKCRSCGGVWLGPNDLKILAEKDHRTWFDRWFGGEE